MRSFIGRQLYPFRQMATRTGGSCTKNFTRVPNRFEAELPNVGGM